VIDLHCHVLPGIDDGPDSIEGSLALARAAAAAGTRILVATPHVSWRYSTDAGTIVRLVEELNARLIEEGVALEVRPGAEIAMTRVLDLEPEQLSSLGLNRGSWLLVEPPFTSVVAGLDAMVLELQRRGHRILLAHPERCHAFHRDRSTLESLVRAGVLTSVTAGSLVGRFGGEVRRFALRLVRDGMVHNVASDAHDHAHRPPGMAVELQQAGFAPLSDWLTRQVPAAILDDSDVPSRPVAGAAPDGRTAPTNVGPGIETARGPWWRRRQ
jgi:protein-tyrosine phosphatase